MNKTIQVLLILSCLFSFKVQASDLNGTHNWLKENQARMDTYMVSGVNIKTGKLLLGTLIATPSNVLYGDLSDGENPFSVRGIWTGKGLIQATPLTPRSTDVFILNVID